MPYVERVTKAGNTIEIERYFTSRYKKPGIKRGDKVKPTKEEQKKVNTRAAERKLRLLLNANFGYGDYHLELDYIRRTRFKTLIMTAHIDKAVEEIERRREAAGRSVEYKAFEMYFMQGMDYAEIAEELDTGKNTPRRWVTGIINELSVLLWGIDEERVKKKKKKIKAWIKRKRETAREQQAADRLIKHIEQALGFELYEWQRLYIITGIWQPPEGRLHGRTTAYILRLLLDQSKPLLLYEFSQVAAYADNPFMGRQYQPVPMQYAGWFRHEIRSIYEQLRAAGVPVREMITEQQRVISW